ncbi:hypothetical protein [Hymenobacter ruricola]|uniref:Uncharacterized protein n=1 Tax=Hymenobacter ruricola TaxID=2791023 RepID=A0ABS0I062_9BACT|nr:hypothetical protein [Hymenobacter ruricola]MBF9220336.1 hypothetical protein [Hymenobacter ruricola]
MPKLIDYPRTSYAGAWELAEIVDDTGGKCAIDTAARKLNRKVSGSFKAIIGSAVKFGLMTSKRELLSTTTLFKRIKHAYDKKEELLFHREAFLTPPLFTQLCRKFRSRELPVQMLDVMLIREFGVEEINAQGVAKAFVEGCRMVGLLDERNIVADIDALAATQPTRRELASPTPAANLFRPSPDAEPPIATPAMESPPAQASAYVAPTTAPQPASDAIASLFGLLPPLPSTPETPTSAGPETEPHEHLAAQGNTQETHRQAEPPTPHFNDAAMPPTPAHAAPVQYQLQVSGPGVNSVLSILEEEDIIIAMALLEKIRRQFRAK